MTLPIIRAASQSCHGCSLWHHATQTIFGDGKIGSRVLLVGEQAGNEEDLQGHPFVGPAGRILDRALEEAGIDRDDAYVTNVVKHFKWEPKGSRRLHKKPNAREIGACLPWLEKEIGLVKPEVLVCLGATAAQALLDKDFKVSAERGRVLRSRFDVRAVATVHPSSILRLPEKTDRELELSRFIKDLELVAGLLNGKGAKRAQSVR